MSDKIVLIIPGFKNYPNENIYREIASLYKKRGIQPQIIHIDWDKRLMSEYVADFFEEYKKHNDKIIYSFGFSFGAMAAFIASANLKIQHQLLCSISPYFSEDLARIEKERKSWIKGVGKKRIEDFQQIRRKELVKNVTAETTLLVGTVEGSIMMDVSKAIYAELPYKKRIEIIKGPGHDISDKRYFEIIKKEIARL